jgi:hypothetical protein
MVFLRSPWAPRAKVDRKRKWLPGQGLSYFSEEWKAKIDESRSRIIIVFIIPIDI